MNDTSKTKSQFFEAEFARSYKFIGPDPGEVEKTYGERTKQTENAKSALEEARKGSGARLTPEQRRAFEKLFSDARPAIEVEKGSFIEPRGSWVRLEPHREGIERTLPSVGRIELEGHWAGLVTAGTGFLVSPSLIMTNRHVVENFAKPDTGWRFDPGVAAQIDFGERSRSPASNEFRLSKVVGVHEKLDLALIRLDSEGRKLPDPLALAISRRQKRVGRYVYAVGYPGFNPIATAESGFEAPKFFKNEFDIKRLSPGKVRKLQSWATTFTHDCTTLGGSSGSPIIDLETHEVLGLHFTGKYLRANRAVELWRVADDPLVRKARLRFAS